MAQQQDAVTKGSSEFAEQVRLYRDKLSRTERQIADYILRNEESISNMSIHTLAEYAGVGVASIIRFSKVLGYNGFADMKFQIQQRRLVIDRRDVGILPTDDANLVKQKVLLFATDALERCIMGTDNNTLMQVSNAVAKANRIFLMGIGTGSAIAAAGASMFMALGMYASSAADSLLGIRSADFLEPGDVMIGLSHPGDSKNVGDTMYFAQKSGATTVLITSQKNSLLGKYADFELYTLTRNQFNSVNISSTSMGQLAILQLIQALVKQKQIPKIEKKSAQVHGHSAITRYDAKQEEIYTGRVRIVEKHKL